jgi:hypothetical protein
MICNFQIGNVYVGNLFELSAQMQEAEGRAGNCQPCTACRQFPALLSTPAVEPGVLACNTGK